MKLIDRGMYLRKLIGAIGTPDIKVVTGVRRCGKSKLLEAFKGYVEANIADANIVHINFNLTKYEKFKDYHVLNDYIESAYKHTMCIHSRSSLLDSENENSETASFHAAI